MTTSPPSAPGDTLKVHVRVVEGNKERVQVFQGAVIRRQGSGVRETFTVRKVSFGVGVERTFPVHSPMIAKIEVVTRGDVRRAKLYYLRDRIGKAAKIKEKRGLSLDPASADGGTERERPVIEGARHPRAVRSPILVAVALLVAFLLKTFVAQAFYIPSGSMEPQLHVGDRVIVSKLAYQLHDPRRGDIVVFPAPDQPPSSTTTPPVRVSKASRGHRPRAARRDRADQAGHRPARRDRRGSRRPRVHQRPALIEPYLPSGLLTSEFPAVKITPGHVWVMGDNRPGSADSRKFGPVDESTIVGRAIVKAWPPWDASFL